MKRNMLCTAVAMMFLCGTASAQVPQLVNYQGRVAAGGVNFDGNGQFKFALVDGGTDTTPQIRTATATASVVNGFVVGAAVTDGGTGYSSAPIVTIIGTGSGVTATATVSGGTVTAITIDNPGAGYTGTTSVAVASPPPPVPATAYVSYWSNDGTSAAGGEPTGHVTLPVSKGLYSVLLGDTQVVGMTSIPVTVFTHADVRLRVWFNDGTHGYQLMTPDQRIAAVAYAATAGSASTAGSATTAGWATTAGSATTAANVPKIGAYVARSPGLAYTAATDGFLVAKNYGYSGSPFVTVSVTLPGQATETFRQDCGSSYKYVTLTLPIPSGATYTFSGSWSYVSQPADSSTAVWIPLAP